MIQEDVLLTGEVRLGHIFFADVLRIAGRDVHGDIVRQLLEVVGACHEIALAVHLDEHTDLAAGVNVAGHRAFAGHARRLLGRNRNALFAQDHDGLLHIALGFGQGLLAIHHWSPGFFPEVFHLCCRNICHSSAH